jgi:hypothetical protein
MNRVITDAGGVRTYRLTLANGLTDTCWTPLRDPWMSWVDRVAWKTLVAELRKKMPRVTIKKRHSFEVIQGEYTEPPRIPSAKKPLMSFWTPWSDKPPKGAA